MKKEIVNTKCPSCKMDVDPEATRCPHCRGKIRKPMSKLVQVFIVIVFIGIVISMIIGDSKPESTSSVTTSNTSTDNMAVGDNGYIRLPNNTDTKQKICLGTTKDDADKISTALLAKDYLGLMEIPGAFCVSNGTHALLIEKSFPLRKVRITGTISKIDEDKFGKSGWLPMEWITK